MGDRLVETVMAGMLAWAARAVVGALDLLWQLLSATAFHTPDVTVLPQVTGFADRCLTLVNAGYVLAFLWAGVLVLGRGTLPVSYGPEDLLPRLVLGLIGANFAIPLCSALIDAGNATTVALTSQQLTSPGSMQHLRDTIAAALDHDQLVSPAGLLLVLLALAVAVLTGLLLVQWIVRAGLLVVAIGIAPVALAMHGTPHTEPLAKLWWRTILGALATVTMQAVALHTTLTIFLDPAANLPALGLPAGAGSTMNLLIILCLLWTITRIPSSIGRYVTGSRAGGRTLLGAVLLHQLTRRLHPLRRTRPRTLTPKPPSPPVGTSAAAALASPMRPLPAPRGAGPGRVGIAYPTGRPIRPYTRAELADGVDLYTRAIKRRIRRQANGGSP